MSGGNAFTGSGYHYYRSDKLNANTWFNNRSDVAKTPLKQNQYGVRAGGPIVIPGLFDGRNKAFFFFNYEEFRQPGAVTRDRTILNTTRAARHLHLRPDRRFAAASQPACTRGSERADVHGRSDRCQPSARYSHAPSPVARSNRLTTISNASGSTSTFESLNRYPTTRIDYNITEKHRFSNAFNYQQFSILTPTR